MSLPTYREHLTDIFDTRLVQDSRALMQELFRQDPDISATVSAYLTMANTELVYVVRDPDGAIDRDGQKLLEQQILYLTNQLDYSMNFQFSKRPLEAVSEELRYMVLLRGAIAAELVFDKTLQASEIRNVDFNSLNFIETAAGVYKPQQTVSGRNEPLPLDIPNFFVEYFRRDPTKMSSYSHFVSAINTIAARQQVINDLYRIMKVTGFPRVDISLVEEVLMKSVPAEIKTDANATRAWAQARLQEIASAYSNLRPDQAFAHMDSVEIKTSNDAKPAAEMNISSVIDVLNGQNQAALKTMSTIIGRGESGVNTASTEARLFALNADALNVPIASMYSRMFNMMLRLAGRPAYVEVWFTPAELRPVTELEPHLTMRQSRLLTLLSLGIITDDYFHLTMFNRIRPDEVPELSGTNFPVGGGPDPAAVSPNSDPLGRSLAPKDTKSASSNTVR